MLFLKQSETPTPSLLLKRDSKQYFSTFIFSHQIHTCVYAKKYFGRTMPILVTSMYIAYSYPLSTNTYQDYIMSILSVINACLSF